MLVIHGHFMDTLQKALVGIQDDPSCDGVGMNTFRGQAIQFGTPNTATSFFEVTPSRVVIRWIGRQDHLGHTPTQTLSLL